MSGRIRRTTIGCARLALIAGTVSYLHTHTPVAMHQLPGKAGEKGPVHAAFFTGTGLGPTKIVRTRRAWSQVAVTCGSLDEGRWLSVTLGVARAL